MFYDFICCCNSLPIECIGKASISEVGKPPAGKKKTSATTEKEEAMELSENLIKAKTKPLDECCAPLGNPKEETEEVCL